MEHENRMRRDAAFARWYTLHHDRIRSLCARILRDEAAGEDLAQETLLRAWTRRDSIRDEDVGAWLSVVARNACVSYLRKNQRAIPVGVVPELPDAAADPSLILEKKEARKAVRRALNEVGERNRRALYLREVEEVGADELGSELGLTAGGTRALLFRARAVMRERLAAAGQGLGAWLVGARVKIGGAYRRARASVAGPDASPLLQAGINLALATGLAVSSIAGFDMLDPTSRAPRPLIASVGFNPSTGVTLDHATAATTQPEKSAATQVSKRTLEVRPGDATSVRPDFRYDKKTRDHFFGIFVDTPFGTQCVCTSGRPQGEGHSIVSDEILEPTLEKLCESSMGYCQSG